MKGETPGLSIGDVAKKLGEKWNNLTAEDKVPYEKKAAKLKEKYEKVNKHHPFCYLMHLICLFISLSAVRWDVLSVMHCLTI